MCGLSQDTIHSPNRLEALLASDGKLLVGYFPAGDPAIPVAMIDAYARAGVDVVEIGIKSDDPFMDGPVVKSSMVRSSGSGALADAGAVVDRLRSRGHAMAALVFAYSSRQFAGTLDGAGWRGIDGLLGLPPLERDVDRSIRASARASGVGIAEFVPFAFGPADIERARAAEAYVMLQAAPGRTGTRERLDASCAARIRLLRAEGVSARIVLGFGISNAEHAAKAIEMGADGVVVGSQCVNKCLAGETALEDFLSGMRSALDE